MGMDRGAHLVALGVRAHEAQDRQAGLRAAVHEAHHLNAGHSVDDNLGQHILQLAGRSI